VWELGVLMQSSAAQLLQDRMTTLFKKSWLQGDLKFWSGF
jgi:hypothetical protein